MDEEFDRAVREMREAQKKYFSTKNTVYLRLSMSWEKKVDEMLAAKAKPEQPRQGTLFG